MMTQCTPPLSASSAPSTFFFMRPCAASLAAIHIAVGELESGRSNMVIAGGVDTGQGPVGYMSFSKTRALSPSGRVATFDKSGDGIVIVCGSLVAVGDAYRNRVGDVP